MHPTRIFKTPEDLEKAWNEYKDSLLVASKKWEKISYVGKDGNRMIDNPKLPLIMKGFESFCYKNYGCVNHYFDNKEGYYGDFGTICRAIRAEIEEDQTIGGMLNMYNPSITQRLNGWKEHTEHSGEIKGIDKEITVNIRKSES